MRRVLELGGGKSPNDQPDLTQQFAPTPRAADNGARDLLGYKVLSAHKVAGRRAAIEAVGARVLSWSSCNRDASGL